MLLFLATMVSKANYNSPDYTLPIIENQPMIFKKEYMSQELLPYEENKPRQVSKIIELNLK